MNAPAIKLWHGRGHAPNGAWFSRQIRAASYAAALAELEAGGVGRAPMRVQSLTLVDESPEAMRRRAAAAWHHFTTVAVAS